MTAGKSALDENLKKLNQRQKEAVEHLDGPLLVYAGPGTGKTQTLSMRIAYMILKQGIDPKSILCLTFTNAGANEMRQRILELTGRAGSEVSVHTYHSFASWAIKNHADFFSEQIEDGEFLEDHEQAVIRKELIDGLDKENPLVKGLYDFKYQNADRVLKDVFEHMYEERPYFLGENAFYTAENIQLYIEHIKANPPEDFIYKVGNKKGTIRTAKLNDEIRKLNKTLSAIKLYPDYRKLLEERKRYTYDDIIDQLLAVFEKFKKLKKGKRKPEYNLALLLEERFEYILLDEFQDTNSAQYKIVTAITSQWKERANIFIVGDEHQMIYRFQGADETNLHHFKSKENYNPKEIFLNENYRSTQAILDAANSILPKGEKDAEQRHLIAKRKPNQGPAPQIYIFDNEEEEHQFIIQAIRALLERGVSFKEIAILYRVHATGEKLSSVLQQCQIPYTINTTDKPFRDPLLRYIILVWKYVAGEAQAPYSQQSLILPILYGVMNDYKANDIAALYHAYKSYEREHSAYLRTFIDTHEAWRQRFPILSDLEEMIETLHKIPLAHIFIFIVTKLKVHEFIVRHTYFTQHADRLRAISYIQRVNKDYAFWANTHLDLHSSLAYLEDRVALYEADKMPLPLFYKDVYEKAYGDKIILSTLHSAKGKEYEYVFIIGNTHSDWEKKGRGNSFTLPPLSFFKGESISQEEEKKKEEERNQREQLALFYVGMTRAKYELTITSNKSKGVCAPLNKLIHKGHGGEGNYLVANYDPPGKELSEKEKQEKEEKKQKEKQERQAQYIAAHNDNPLPEPQPSDWKIPYLPAVQTRFGGNFRLSYSRFNNYQACPFSFYMQELFSVNACEEEKESFNTQGLKFHDIITDLWHQALDKNQFPQIGDSFQDVIHAPNELQTYFTELFQSYHNAAAADNLPLADYIFTEHNLKPPIHKDMCACGLNGRLDHLCLLPSHKKIIDFKLVFSDKKLKEKQKQWQQQALFYKILVDEQAKTDDTYKGVNEAVFVYITTDGNKGEYVFDFNTQALKEEKEALRKKIEAIWQDIQSWQDGKEFAPCDNAECAYCSDLLQP